MAITVRTGTNPSVMAANWSAGMARGSANWAKGVKAPRKLPNADPAKNAASWQTGVAAAGPAMLAGISSPSYLTKLEAGIPAGTSKFGSAGTSRLPQATEAFGKLAGIIDTAVTALPPKGLKGTNSARAAAFGELMHAQKGRAKAS